MRTISAQEITDTVARLCIEANTRLPQDVQAALDKARQEEPWPLAKSTLDLLWSNLSAAKEENLPICQDTGMACVFVELGTDVHIDGSFEAAIHEGVRRGYTDGYLRKSIVADPLRRGNTGDNTPAAITVHLVDGEGCRITVAPKGFGSENMSQIKMLKPADGVEGFKKFVLDTVKLAGSNPCPPIVLGIGVGGSFDKVAYLAKKALLRPLDVPNPDPYYAQLEQELLAAINELGIGPQGFGGRTTCLGLAIEQMPTHVAGLPAAVNVSCHVTRRASEWELIQTGAIFHTTTDSEVIAFHIARERVHSATVEEAVHKTVEKIRGGYALVIMSPRKLIGARDPYGLKPLCLGKRDNAYVLASESCALTSVGAEFIRDIEPGEIVTITKNGLKSSKLTEKKKHAHCVFEYIYFARLDSTMDGVKIYDARIRGGKSLAKSYPVEADLVTGVPESGLPAAKGYSEESGIPFGFAFYKNSYIGRTFIKPTQQERESSVHLKLSVLESVVKGKRIVLVDDSIVRGTTIANLIHMLKEAGAKEVHVRISSPPFLHPCYFGTDVPSNDQLIAAQHSTEEIRKMIGADSLGYMQIDYLEGMAGGLPLCKACFDGNYPMEIPAEIKKD